MPKNRKPLIITCLLAVVIFSAMTAMKPARDDDDHGFKNLKVLPKHITHEQLESTMHDWSHALGVHCNFCHARTADGKMDFASDEKPEKNMARDMYKMAAKINDKYFEGKKDSIGMVVGDIKCYTCHRGSPHPDEVKDMSGPGNMQHGPGPGPAMPPGGNPPPQAPPSGN
jgi:hypothetical protein